MQQNFGHHPDGVAGVADDAATTRATVSIEVEDALAGLNTASQTSHRPDPRHYELIVANLPLLPPHQLDGVVFLLRATCTSEVIAYMDEHAVWPLLASAKDKDGTTPYGNGERARREFVAFSESNTATLAHSDEEHAATLAQADAMLAGTGIRRSRPESFPNLMPWRRLIRRVVGLPRSRQALYWHPRQRRDVPRASSRSRRARARSPARPRSRPDDESEPSDDLSSPSGHGTLA